MPTENTFKILIITVTIFIIMFLFFQKYSVYSDDSMSFFENFTASKKVVNTIQKPLPNKVSILGQSVKVTKKKDAPVAAKEEPPLMKKPAEANTKSVKVQPIKMKKSVKKAPALMKKPAETNTKSVKVVKK